MKEKKRLLSDIPYANLYDRKYKSLIYSAEDSYWNDSYGQKMDSRDNAKIIVLGLPKSGNTFLVSLIAGALSLDVIDPVREIGRRGVGMSHRPFSPHLDREDFLHGAVVVRDIRDVVASFYEYSQTKYFREARLEFQSTSVDEFYYEWFLSKIHAKLNVLKYAETYANMGLVVVKYERLILTPEIELRKLLMTFGIEGCDEKIKLTVAKNSFEKLKDHGIEFGDNYVPPSHFNRGHTGRYKSVLTEKIIKDIEVRFHDYLSRWGYSS